MGEPRDTRTASARAYYRALDEGDYALLADLLAPAFVHERPDRTIDGRDAFVTFMREKRPMTDTTHPIRAVYEQTDGTEVAVRGDLLDGDGERITAFVDVLAFEAGRISQIQTFTD